MNCKNCNTKLSENSEFCNSCGGKVIRNRLTFRNLFEHLIETFFNYDNKLLRTFITLFKNPEDVIGGYVKGIRKRYVNPISFFGIILTINGLNVFIISKFYRQYIDPSNLIDDTAINKNVGSQQIMTSISEVSLEFASLLFSGLIPFIALISLIVFYNKKYNYTEHLIVYLYSMSVYSFIASIFGLLVLALIPEKYLLFGTMMYVFIFIYHCYVLKRLFQLTITQLILKTLLFFVLFFMSYVGITIVVFIVLFATGTISLEDFAPK